MSYLEDDIPDLIASTDLCPDCGREYIWCDCEERLQQARHEAAQATNDRWERLTDKERDDEIRRATEHG